MKANLTKLPGLLVLEPEVYTDDRGYFLETWAQRRYADAGVPDIFVQDNLSFSRHGVLRGLHFQHPFGQGKLVQVVHGEVFDVAVDVRVGSPSYGQWVGRTLSADNRVQIYIPPGFAHGFCVVSETALFAYKCTEAYHRDNELGVAWNDPELGITWPISDPRMSTKDAEFCNLRDIDPERLPRYA